MALDPLMDCLPATKGERTHKESVFTMASRRICARHARTEIGWSSRIVFIDVHPLLLGRVRYLIGGRQFIDLLLPKVSISRLTFNGNPDCSLSILRAIKDIWPLGTALRCLVKRAKFNRDFVASLLHLFSKQHIKLTTSIVLC
jgi:hypothetical protein